MLRPGLFCARAAMTLKKQSKAFCRYVGIPLGILLGLIMVVRMVFITRLRVPGTGNISVEYDGPLATLHSSTYRINYKTSRGSRGTVYLHGNFDCNPLIVFSQTNGDILCLYDADVLLRLIRIDPNRPREHFSPKSALNWIIAGSTCFIEQGHFREWNSVSNYFANPQASNLKATWIPTLDYGIGRISADPKLLSNRVSTQIDYMFNPKNEFFDDGKN
jgi:hypothetical protein